MDRNNSKYCRKCHQIKPLNDFSNDKFRVDGKRYECKVCTKATNAKYYQKQKQKLLDMQNRIPDDQKEIIEVPKEEPLIAA